MLRDLSQLTKVQVDMMNIADNDLNNWHTEN